MFPETCQAFCIYEHSADMARGSFLARREWIWDYGKGWRFKAILIYHLSNIRLGTGIHKRNK